MCNQSNRTLPALRLKPGLSGWQRGLVAAGIARSRHLSRQQASRPFRKHLVVLLQVASGSAAVPATAHRRFHVEKKQRRGLPVTLPETIVRRRCAALIPYARNARTHSDQQVAQIAASIREFGFTNPVLIDEEDGIIAGAGRVLAAHLLGLDEVPCIVLAHLTPTQRRAYVLADNKLALNAGWDLEMLSLEIGELGEAGIDLSLTGFDEFELGELFAERTQGRPDPADAPEPPAPPVAEPGDLWELGCHRLLCGDSTVATDVARVLGGVAPHLMVTDPPYGVNYDPAWRNQAGRSINGTTRRIAVGTVIARRTGRPETSRG